MGQAGRETVEQKYSAITQAPRVYEIFKSVLRDARVPVSHRQPQQAQIEREESVVGKG